MKTLMFFAVAAATLINFAPPSHAASFACDGRLNVTERTICANAGLSNLDYRIGQPDTY